MSSVRAMTDWRVSQRIRCTISNVGTPVTSFGADGSRTPIREEWRPKSIPMSEFALRRPIDVARRRERPARKVAFRRALILQLATTARDRFASRETRIPVDESPSGGGGSSGVAIAKLFARKGRLPIETEFP